MSFNSNGNQTAEAGPMSPIDDTPETILCHGCGRHHEWPLCDSRDYDAEDDLIREEGWPDDE